MRLICRPFRPNPIHCFNLFNVCTYPSELIVVPVFFNSTSNVQSLSQRALMNDDLTWKSLHLDFVLPCPPYTPDSAPSNFQFFGPLMDALLGHYFADEEL